MGFHVDDAIEFGNTARDTLLTLKLDKEIARAKQAEAELARAGSHDVGAALTITRVGNRIDLNLFAKDESSVPLSSVSFETAAAISGAECDEDFICHFYQSSVDEAGIETKTDIFTLDLGLIKSSITDLQTDLQAQIETIKKFVYTSSDINIASGKYITRLVQENNVLRAELGSYVSDIKTVTEASSVPPTSGAVKDYVDTKIQEAVHIDITPEVISSKNPEITLKKNTLVLCNPVGETINSLKLIIPDIIAEFKPGDVFDLRFKTGNENITVTVENNQRCRIFKYGRRVNDNSAIWTYNQISARADVSIMAENSGFGYVDIYIYEAI